MLDPNSAQPGDVIRLTASYAEPGGDTRQAVKKITVGSDGGLYFGILQDIDYLGPAGFQQFDWQLTASVSGLAASQPGITYSWYLNGVLKESGPAKTYILQRRGLPTVMDLRLVADDGQGHTGEQSVKLDFRALAPGEPGQRYDAWRKAGVSFTNELGVPIVPDPAKKTKGLIVLTHGIWSSPYADWIKSLAAEIESKLTGPDLPNILIFGWNQYATPNLRYGTTPQEIENLVVPYLQVKGGVLAGILKADKSYLDGFFDFAVIRPVAENVGRSKLAQWFVDEELLGNISKTARIHLIGHSAGGFVMGECYKELRGKGFNIQRVTMLDTPFVKKLHVDVGNPAVIERYVSSPFGKLCPEIDPIRYGPVGPPYIDEKPESAYYHRLDVGNGGNLNPKEAHGYSHDWYQGTVPSNPDQEGFQISPFITAASIPAPAPNGPQNAPIPLDGPVEAPMPPSSLDGFTTFGSVSGLGSPYVLTESGNSGIVRFMSLPADAAGLTFQYQFTSPGDGDFLEVFFGDGPPLYIASPTSSNTQGMATAEISLAPFAGQTGNLVIKLVAQEAANAVVTVENIQLTLDDDIDGDGLLAAAEVASGTDPRFADTDGDGIEDPTELNNTLTNPVLADSDGDGANDGSELAAGTDPLDGSSRFAVKSSVKAGANFTVTWSSVATKRYRILRSPEPDFGTYDVISSGIAAAPPQQSFTDVGGATGSRMFYRVELEP